jgi:hypothetical protein
MYDGLPSICGSDNRTNLGVHFLWINKSGVVETPTTKVVVEPTTIEVVVEIITSPSPPWKLYSLKSLKEKQIDLQNLQRIK